MADLLKYATETAGAAARLCGHVDQDWKVLAEASPVTMPWAATIARRFIAKLYDEPATAPIMRTRSVLERENVMTTWFENILSGTPTPGFWAECCMAGLVHAKMGVEAGLVAAASGAIEESFLAHAMSAFEPSGALRVFAAFRRVLTVAIAVMLSAQEDSLLGGMLGSGVDATTLARRVDRDIAEKLKLERARLPIMEWSDALSVRIPSIDGQHRVLFDMLNQFHQANINDSREVVVHELLDELVEYTKIHFAFEETLLDEYGYPELAQHKLAHHRLADQVARYVDAFGENRHSGLGSDLYLFLRMWLNGHIRGSDRRYSAHLLRHGAS
ncbi:MAG: bacteriohemerythrin [Polyangiaceae bacterium]